MEHLYRRMLGLYGLYLYLPLSRLSRKWRRFSRRIRNKHGGLLQQVRLPEVSWRRCVAGRIPELWEADKVNGNIRISELAVISLLARDASPGSILFEIGTFDGRTSLNLAFSSADDCRIYTLDLPPDMDTAHALAEGERHMVEKERSGARIVRYRESHPHVADKITQLYGDSATFDFSDYFGRCSLVFVDGSHAYEYARSDSMQAFRMVQKGGVVLWHDYGIWEGVTRALEELEDEMHLGLRNIAGTSLVYWRKP